MRRHLRGSGFVLLLAVLAAGCATGVDSAVFMSAPPLPAGSDVRIYNTQLPACAYDEIGLVTWEPSYGWQKLQTGVDRIRERARQMGGHAIIGFSIGSHVSGTSTTITADSSTVSVGSSVNTHRTVSGTVIRFRNGDCGR